MLLRRTAWRLAAAGAVLAGAAGPAAAQTAFTWQGDSGGLWNQSVNWLSTPPGGSFPNAANHTATFDTEGNPGGVVNVNGTFTVSGLTFQNLTWTLNGSGGTPSLALAATSGSTIAAQVQSPTTINTVLTGSGITKTGMATLTLTQANTYTGGTAINAGVVQVGNGAGNTTASINGTGTISLGSTTAQLIHNRGGTDTISQAITGSGSATAALTKQGGGTLLLTGVNTFTGGTTVASGAVYANNVLGAGAGTVTVNSGGTLGGTGTVGQATTFNSGSTLDIGDGTANDIDDLAFSNSLSLAAGSTATFNFNDNFAAVAGTGYDAVTAGGAVTLAGAFNPVVNNLGSESYVGVTMKIIDGQAGMLSGTFSNYTVSGQQIMELNSFGGVAQWFLVYDYVNGDVLITPIPEPASVLGVAAAGLGLARWARRRRGATAAVPA